MPPPKNKKLSRHENGEPPVTEFRVTDRRLFADTQDVEDTLDNGPAPKRRLPSYVSQLEEEKHASIEQLKQYIQSYKEMQKEMDAARTRMARDIDKRVTHGKMAFFQKLLGLLDNFERSLKAAGDRISTDPVLHGIELICQDLINILTEEGVERCQTVGLKFDPAIAEAIGVVPTKDPDEDELVVDEVLAGYRFGDTLLRPARVHVARYTNPSDKAI